MNFDWRVGGWAAVAMVVAVAGCNEDGALAIRDTTRLLDTTNPDGPYDVYTVVFDRTGAREVNLRYRLQGDRKSVV